MTHADRINTIVAGFEEAMSRLQARLTGAAAADAEGPRADGGWSAAQIAWHVAAVNESFASLIDGRRPVAQPAPEGFVERTWEEIAASLADRLQAPSRVQPAGPVTRDEAAAKLSASREALLTAVRGLAPERGVLMLDAPVVGRVTLYQVGEWAIAHVIRHNRQMKDVLAARG